MWSAWRLTPTRSSTSPPSSPMLSGGSWSAAWSWARWAPGNMSQKSMASERRGAFACKYCDGFWKGSRGSSRVVQLMGRSAGKQLSLQLILDEPPERLWQQWIKDRMEYYLRVEPVDAIRDEALDHSYPVEERIRFSIRNGLGTVSDLIWGILLSNPERDGLYQIQKLAAKKVKPQWIAEENFKQMHSKDSSRPAQGDRGLYLKLLCTCPFGAYVQTNPAETWLAQLFRSKKCVSGRGHDRIATPFSFLPWSCVPHHLLVDDFQLHSLGVHSRCLSFAFARCGIGLNL